jgi:hypothetical protein
VGGGPVGGGVAGRGDMIGGQPSWVPHAWCDRCLEGQRLTLPFWNGTKAKPRTGVQAHLLP